MNTEEKLNEYKQRHKEWRNISVTQLSNANNILITLSTGLLALGLTPRTAPYNSFSCIEKISFILLFISVCYGLAVLFTRLYDFRISRHLILTRQRFYKKHIENKEYKKGLLPDNYLGDVCCCDRIRIFSQILFCKIDFINKDDIETQPFKDIKNRFNALRREADILGSATWIWTKFQVLFFLISALIYFINQIIKL